MDAPLDLDPSGMHRAYDDWPRLAREAHERRPEPAMDYRFDHVVFAGMGGSGALGEIFHSLLSRSPVHVDIVKGYRLPYTTGPGSLVVATSVSGRTAETISVLRSAQKTGCRMVGFSSGGPLQDMCGSCGIPHYRVEQVHSPRASLVSYLYSMMGALGRLLPVSASDVGESLDHLDSLAARVSSSNREQNPALDLASWLSGTPVILYPWGLRAAAVRFKNSLQENAKTHAMTEDIIESCHNGIVGWESESDAQPVMIRGADDGPTTRERWKVMSEYFAGRSIEFREVASPAGSLLTKLVGLIYLLDYASVYLALLRGADPAPVESIDYVKSRIKPGHL